MKLRNFLFVATLLIGSCTTAMAQFSNAVGSSSTEIAPYYNRLTLGYNATLSSQNKDFSYYLDTKIPTLNGFAIKYIHGFGLSKYIPLYIETGLKANMGFGALDVYDDYKPDIYLLSFGVPINISYRLGLNDNISLQPYTGLNFKVNALGKIKQGSQSIDIFSEDVDKAGNRFQMGWQIGLGFNFNKFYLGIEYGLDFIKLINYEYRTNDYLQLKTSHVEACIGLNF